MTSYLHLHQREGLIPLIVLKTRFLGLGALGFPSLLPANSVIISTANAVIKVLQFVLILQPSLYHL